VITFSTVFILTHPVHIPCGRKLEHPEKTHDFRQSVDWLFTWVRSENRTHDCATEAPILELSNRWYQDVFALLVPSCCDKSGTSCYHPVTRLIIRLDLLDLTWLVDNQTSDLLEQLVASLLLSSTLLQVNNLSITWKKQCAHILLTSWDSQLLTSLEQVVIIL
jgi:hypothetical protein